MTRQGLGDLPKAILSVALPLVNVCRLPLRFKIVFLFPEIDKEVRDLACGWQEALQVDCVVAGEAEAASRDDGCTELQTPFRTDREIKQKGKGGSKI